MNHFDISRAAGGEGGIYFFLPKQLAEINTNLQNVLMYLNLHSLVKKSFGQKILPSSSHISSHS